MGPRSTVPLVTRCSRSAPVWAARALLLRLSPASCRCNGVRGWSPVRLAVRPGHSCCGCSGLYGQPLGGSHFGWGSWRGSDASSGHLLDMVGWRATSEELQCLLRAPARSGGWGAALGGRSSAGQGYPLDPAGGREFEGALTGSGLQVNLGQGKSC